MKKDYKEALTGGVFLLIAIMLFFGNPSKEEFQSYYKDKMGHWSINTNDRVFFVFFSLHSAESYNINTIYQSDVYIGFGFLGWEYFVI